MPRTYRLPAFLLALVAIAAAAVIGLRLAADADQAPQDDTSPVVIAPPSAPVQAPTPAATETPQPPSTDDADDDEDDDFDRTVPEPRDYDDVDDDPDDDDAGDDRDDD